MRARIPYLQRSNPFDHRGTIAPRGAILWAACVLSLAVLVGCGGVSATQTPTPLKSPVASIDQLPTGTVVAWGYNGGGEMGNGTTTDSITPVQVSGLTDAKAVATGIYAAYGVRGDGTVWAWGTNKFEIAGG